MIDSLSKTMKNQSNDDIGNKVLQKSKRKLNSDLGPCYQPVFSRANYVSKSEGEKSSDDNVVLKPKLQKKLVKEPIQARNKNGFL